MATLEEKLAETKESLRKILHHDLPDHDVDAKLTKATEHEREIEDKNETIKGLRDRIKSIELRIARIRIAQEAFEDACMVSPHPDRVSVTYRLFLKNALRRAQ